ncbi:MAG: hypothetical protein SPE33_04220 [[Pasteurella] aerogenes]|nr:hypothetical protein [[Pasteurella] aerogenes]
MKYYIKEVFSNEKNNKNAGSKARLDVERVLDVNGYKSISIFLEDNIQNNICSKILLHITKFKEIKKNVSHLNKGDEVIIQYPMVNHSILFADVIRKLTRKGVKITLLIHDLELFRQASVTKSFLNKIRILFEEISALKTATKIIAHNDIMKSKLIDKGISSTKIVSLEIFDYLIPNDINLNLAKRNLPIIIAGNLSPIKAGYLSNLPMNIKFNLFGVGFIDNSYENVSYKGAFLPDDLVKALDGSFGLVWDGDSSETCSGVFGEYLRINNSHKASLYLAAGYPLIVWKHSALAKFVMEHKCGITVDSLSELNMILCNISDEYYSELVSNTHELSLLLRSGTFLLKAISKDN